MSSELMKKISGQLTDTNNTPLSQLPFGITIEMTTTASPPASNPGGWIGSAPVENTGSFDLFTAYGIATTETVNYQIFKDSQLMIQGTVVVNNFIASIPLTAIQYQSLLPDVGGYVTIKGRVTLDGTITRSGGGVAVPNALMAAVPNGSASVTVVANKVQFRSSEILASSSIDTLGNYCITIPLSSLGVITTSGASGLCDQKKLSKIFISLNINDSGDIIMIERTENITLGDTCTQTVDISTAQTAYFDFFYTELEYASNVVTQTIGSGNPFYNVIVDGDNSELNDIIDSTNLDPTLVTNLIKASIATHATSIVLDHTYALTRTLGPDVNQWTSLTLDGLTAIVNDNKDSHIIPSVDNAAVTLGILTSIKNNFLVSATTNNGDTISSVFQSFMGSDADTVAVINKFISLSDSLSELRPDDFWVQINAQLGATAKDKLQRGLQTMTLSGMQPETTKYLMDTLSGVHTSPPVASSAPISFAAFTIDKWNAIVQAVSTANGGKVCVPEYIKLNATDTSDAGLKSAYATKLMEATHALYPTAVLSSQITLDRDFATAIGANASDVKTFLNTNQAFDLRYNNAWDIDTSITNGVAIQQAMLPMQNLLRIAPSQPLAVAAMLKAGLKSSADIVALPQTYFVNTFGSTFIGKTTATQVYATAAQMALTTAQLQIQFTPNVLTSASPATGNGTSIYTLYDTPPANSQTPDLSTLFGSMDMCNCSECTSMYSPGAYYTDILNFIQNQLFVDNTALTAPFAELIRRRPDLVNIDLTCKNANTALPYIDLVNELLESKIMAFALGINLEQTYSPTSYNKNSYQTGGTAAELAAYPEHTVKMITSLSPYTYVYQSVPSVTGSGGVTAPGYQQVYNSVLSTVKYPNDNPLHLPIEETRTYFNHLGFSRYNLMQKFKPTDFATVGDSSISEFNMDAEWFGISNFAASVIIAPSANTWEYYGFPSSSNLVYLPLVPPSTTPTSTSDAYYNELCNATNAGVTLNGLHTLLRKANISYTELLQLMVTDFLNPMLSGTTGNRRFAISNILSAAVDTCDLDRLQIVYKGAIGDTIGARQLFFNFLHRFIRLQRATGWSIYQLDMVLNAMQVKIGYPSAAAGLYNDISVDVFKRIASIHQLATTLGTDPEKIVSLWSDLSIRSYIDFNTDNQNNLPSVYDSLFQNKALTNPVDSKFTLTASGALPVTTNTVTGNTGTIMAALNITADELTQLFTFIGSATALDLTKLSRVYGLTVLARGLGISIDYMMRLFVLYGITWSEIGVGTANGILNKIQFIQNAIKFVQTLTGLAFSLDEVEYLVEHKDDALNFIPADETIALFYQGLSAALQKQFGNTQGDNAAVLKNIVVRQFSTNFGIGGDMAQYLLDGILNGEAVGSTATRLSDVLTTNAFISVAPSSILSYKGIKTAYLKAHKIALIVNRLNLSIEEVGAIQSPIFAVASTMPVTITGIAPFNFPAFADIPTPTTSSANVAFLNAFINLSDWIRNRDRLNLRNTEFVDVLTKAAAAHASYSSTNVTAYLKALNNYTEWDADSANIPILSFLAGASVGVLDIASGTPLNFKDAATLAQLSDIMGACSVMGITPQVAYNALQKDIALTTSQTIRQAAKSKHTNDEWLTIAKPLQDVLRRKQRNALVAYMVAHPEIGETNAAGTDRWKDANGLFAYYLIDVEMESCMKTSRIKQAISSVQLYMDRIIMNLENTAGNSANHIVIPPDLIDQWETWRKWYRVWEANREVFLYPENWMEPDLRDDKTPFFKDMESQLLQNAVTDETAEDAFRAYLEALDQVAKLEPVTAYHQLEKDAAGNITKDVKHVFSRTTRLPYRYFYRRFENNIWSPWEAINVDIQSDHVVPIIYQGRLILHWLTFVKKTSHQIINNDHGVLNAITNQTPTNAAANLYTDKGGIMTIKRDAANNADDFAFTWDLKLNWSQYKDGKWLASETVDDPMSLLFEKCVLTQIEVDSFTNATSATLKEFFQQISKFGEYDIANFVKARTHISCNPIPQGGYVVDLLYFGSLTECASSLVAYWFPDASTKPYINRAGNNFPQLLSPVGTWANNMKFQKIPTDTSVTGGQLKIEKVVTRQDKYFVYCDGIPSVKYFPRLTYDSISSSVPLLAQTRDTYKLTRFGSTNPYKIGDIANALFSTKNPSTGQYYTQAQIEGSSATVVYKGANSCIYDYFFFEDDINTYYVKRIDKPSILVNLPTSITMSSSEAILKGSLQYYTSDFGTNYPVSVKTDFSKLPETLAAKSAGGQTLEAPYQPYTYHFETFYHAQIHDFMNALNRDGVPGLLKLKNQAVGDTMHFGPLNGGNYKPTTWVDSDYPTNKVQFDPEDAYSIYNWELFFHAPMSIAQKLSDNQQFEDAQKWYHYVFNPLSTVGPNGITPVGTKERFWKFYPFYQEALNTPVTLTDLLSQVNQASALNAQVQEWQNNPFEPYAIARMRRLAFMKNVLMKYIDNLIAWGDQLFRQDTIESINEATQLYILAANILGDRPEMMPTRVKKDQFTFTELETSSISGSSGFNALSNAMVNIESFFAPNTYVAVSINTTSSIPGKSFYFCLPQNSILMGYWDTVADRLFKIRNCMNINGVVQQLPLYDPPIDPALLVKATAMGIDIASIVDAFNNGNAAVSSNYRFTYMLQKANEFCGEVRSLGGALLSAIEKKDSEALALLRSGQEMNMLDQMTFIKQSQVDDAQATLDNLNLAKENTQARYDYYSSRPYMNDGEQQQLKSVQAALVYQKIQGGLESTAGVLGAIPNFHAQGLSSGTSMGSENYASIARAASSAIGILAAINNTNGSMAATKGSYDRRNDDWVFQTGTASKELEQMDKQILGAQIRLDIANRELSNHQLQIDNTRAVDTYMRNKFSNEDLYNWMVGQVSDTYFQSYQLAYDLAQKAQACYKYELPVAALSMPAGGFITFGYWDSLRKGLLSGEKLQFDLRKMESSYMDQNKRELELTKNISLALFDPKQILALRKTGTCDIYLPEELYDLDYPGHFNRRIKSVSISIPCIAGPYTTIPATLTLSSSYLRKGSGTALSLEPYTSALPIATSSAQNDGGVFELNFRDERYLPFEGRGAVSHWQLSLLAPVSSGATNKQVRTFDFETISDVILHVRYMATASTDGGTFAQTRIDRIVNLLKTPSVSAPYSEGTYSDALILPRYFSLKHEFSNEWYKGFNALSAPSLSGSNVGREMDLTITQDLFPEYAQGGTVKIPKVTFILPQSAGTTNKYGVQFNGTIVPLNTDASLGFTATFNLSTPITITQAAITSPNFTFSLVRLDTNSPYNLIGSSVNESDLQDVFFVMDYFIA